MNEVYDHIVRKSLGCLPRRASSGELVDPLPDWHVIRKDVSLAPLFTILSKNPLIIMQQTQSQAVWRIKLHVTILCTHILSNGSWVQNFAWSTRLAIIGGLKQRGLRANQRFLRRKAFLLHFLDFPCAPLGSSAKHTSMYQKNEVSKL